MQKIWNVKKYDERQVADISNKFNISSIMAKLLIAKEIKLQDIEMYLNGTIDSLRDPFDLKDMEIFVKRVILAINNKEKICIYGDYDVDGITSITIMYKFLKSIGADVMYYLPDRLIEGYGVNKEALREIASNNVKLIITVDCGITAVEETEYAKSLGVDMCITDHHECSKTLPNSVCIINPKQENDTSYFKMFAGVGVAFKCIVALCKKLSLSEENYLKYLDIVAIGTVSDIVSLLDENRVITKYGINLIKETKNVGLMALLEFTKFKNTDSTMISFGLAPRINACGRMGNASLAVKLFLEEDYEKAKELAIMLDKLNYKRQQVEKEIFDSAIYKITKFGIDQRNSLVVYDKSWHSGVIGIVASRLVNIYNKPVILLTNENGIVRGSGRCPKGISIYEVLDKCRDDVIQFGGHELAAGLSIKEEKIEDFTKHFDEMVFRVLDGKTLNQVIDIDMEISLDDLNISLLKDVYKIKPYGQANRPPLFLYKGLKVQAVRKIGEGKHLKLVLQDKNKLIDAVGFLMGDRRDEILIGEKIDIVCQVDVNDFNGKKTIQLLLEDFKKSLS